jgi:single-strand DNA-binding protein
MAGSVNKVIIIGNLGRDPEIRSTQDGKRIANLSVGTSESWKDKNSGERKEKTEWHRVAVYNDGLAEVVEKYLKKGAKVYIEGALQTRKWTDNAGQEKYSTEVVLKAYHGVLTMLDTARSNGADAPARGRTPPQAAAPMRGTNDFIDDDIPFASCDPAAEPYLNRRIVA